MDFCLLGPLLVRRDGSPVEVGPPKQRALLIHLLLRVGETVPVDRLIDALWEDDPPPQARVTLRSYVSSLRRAFEKASEAPVIVTRGSGYALQIDPEAVDAVRFARLVARGRADLAAGNAHAAVAALDAALELWRGQALADVADKAFATGERTRLEELRLSAREDRFDALLALGRHSEAVAALEAFTAEAPGRERAQAQLMLALYRSGRAGDALAVFTRYRRTLAEELGLDPSPRLHLLADNILRQASELDGPPVQAAVIARRMSATPTTSMPPPLLVGRAHERAELQRAVDRLLSGSGGLLLVAGEAGIGKSALLEELARVAGAAGLGVRWGRCQETKGAPAFWPWVRILRDIAGELDDEQLRAVVVGSAEPITHLVDAIAQRVAAPRRVPDEDVEAARFQLYDAIATFLLSVAEQRPLVLLVDDLHWADAPSLETLAFLTPLVGSGRILIAGSYRDVRADWSPQLEATLATVAREPSTQQVGLVGLQPVAVAELAERVTGYPMSDRERELLHQRTGGNPFFVRQLSRLLRETSARPDGELLIPAGVRHVIARRLSLLPVPVRQLLESAAVVGGRFDVRWLAAATDTDPDDALDAATTAVDHGLIEAVERSATSYRFVHALVRETIYDGLAPLRAARIHANVAAALQSTPQAPAATLAEHFWRAADLLDDDRPVRYLIAAADQAGDVFAHEQAETYLRRALRLLTDRNGDTTTELEVRVKLVQLLVGVHGWSADAVEEIAAPARQLARTASFRPDVLPLWSALFSQYMARGDADIAREMMEQLLAEAEHTGHPVALAAGHAAAAHIDTALRNAPASGLEHATQAQHHAQKAVAEYPQAQAEQLQIHAAYLAAIAHAYLGQEVDAIEACHRSMALADDLGNPFWRAAAAQVCGFVGVILRQPAFSAQVTEDGLSLCARHGFQTVGHLSVVANSWGHAQLGKSPADNADRMEDAIDAVLRTGHIALIAELLVYTAEIHLLVDNHPAASHCLERARALSERSGEALPQDRLRDIETELTTS